MGFWVKLGNVVLFEIELSKYEAALLSECDFFSNDFFH